VSAERGDRPVRTPRAALLLRAGVLNDAIGRFRRMDADADSDVLDSARDVADLAAALGTALRQFLDAAGPRAPAPRPDAPPPDAPRPNAARPDARRPGTRVLDEIEYEPVEVAGYAVYVSETIWNGGGRCFDVYRVLDGACLTKDESEDTYPSTERIAALITARGQSDCDECGNTVPDDGNMFSAFHADSCSLHPANLAPGPGPGRPERTVP
jgi:hypothetical protein